MKRLAEVILLVCIGWAVVPEARGAEGPPAPVRDADRVFRRHVFSWQELKRRNVVMQKRDFSCGAAALATLIQYYWEDEVTEDRILVELDGLLTPEEIADRIQNGLTLTDLRRVAVRVGYQASIGKLEFDKLSEAKVPLVVGIEFREYKHFVVYRGTDGRYVYLADPARGNVRMPVWSFLESWQENAVLAVAKPGEQIKEYSALSVTWEEALLGELNGQLIRKNFLGPAPSAWTR